MNNLDSYLLAGGTTSSPKINKYVIIDSDEEPDEI